MIEKDLFSSRSVKDITVFFGCCASTIERRINEYNIPRRFDVYSAISDAGLDEKVSSVVSFFPRCGQKSVDGRLRSEGILVSRKRKGSPLEQWIPWE